MHPLIAQLLAGRGVTDREAAQRFLLPKLQHLHDPTRLPGAVAAAKRIAQAVKDSQPIVIYGDYDVDGVTASAILWHTLKLAGAQVSTYVPHRLEEGYGLNSDAITELAQRDDNQTPLIISVDCGITAIEQANLARQLNVDLIITDHHTFDPENLPDACALVHPQLGEAIASTEAAGEAIDAPAGQAAALLDRTANYPCEDLCGAGVAFKLAWQVAREICGSDRLPDAYRELMVDLLSLVALGTVADVVPLVDENRVLTAFGLGRIKQTRFLGLNALIDAARLRDEKIDAYHVGFVLGPRLNACGRMGHAKQAVHLLTEAEPTEAAELAKFLTAENDRRRATEREIFDQAHEIITEQGYASEDRRAIVVGKEGWHPGVIGIVASRLVERFGRPVVMLAYDDQGVAKGSARSVDGVSIHEAFVACAAHFTRFGGHTMAAGLTMPVANVDALREDLVAYINDRLAAEDLTGIINVDGELTLDQCTLNLFDQLNRLAPFGRGNPTPRLLLRGVSLESPAHTVGAHGAHLSLLLRQGDSCMKAIAFGMGELAPTLPAGAVLDVVFEPKVSTWQGRRRAELHVQDLRPTSS